MNKKIISITEKYYSHFVDMNLSTVTDGIHYVKSERRNEILKGLGCKYSIYILKKDNKCIITYSPKYERFISSLKEMEINNQIEMLKEKFQLKKYVLMIFDKEKFSCNYNNTRLLTKEDYTQYESFFREVYPCADPEGWLESYFLNKVSKEYFVGSFENEMLVSVSDAPDMPFMEGLIQHTGIATLSEYRNKGYAKQTSALATHHLLEMGVVPQWECDSTNEASIQLAEAIGYKKYAEAFILEE